MPLSLMELYYHVYDVLKKYHYAITASLFVLILLDIATQSNRFGSYSTF